MPLNPSPMNYGSYLNSLSGYGAPTPAPNNFGSYLNNLSNYGAPAIPPVNPSSAMGNNLAAALSNYGSTNGSIPAQAVERAAGFTSPEVAMPTASTGGWFDSFTDKLKGANGWMQDIGLLGKTDEKGVKTDGWGGLLFGGIGALSQMQMGNQMLANAKANLALQRESFNFNKDTTTKQLNSQLADRQAARVAADPSQQSVSDYMKKYGV